MSDKDKNLRGKSTTSEQFTTLCDDLARLVKLDSELKYASDVVDGTLMEQRNRLHEVLIYRINALRVRVTGRNS